MFFFEKFVNVLLEEQETVYKLYFKNNIEKTDKSLMTLVRKLTADGAHVWACKKDFFA